MRKVIFAGIHPRFQMKTKLCSSAIASLNLLNKKTLEASAVQPVA